MLLMTVQDLIQELQAYDVAQASTRHDVVIVHYLSAQDLDGTIPGISESNSLNPSRIASV